MSLKDPAFPASSNFDEIANGLKDEAIKKDALKVKTVFAFQLKNDAGATESWYLDLKKGEVGKGASPPDGKADVTLVLSDKDFGALAEQKANAQKLFMSGKLKIKGDMMKATRLEPVLKKAQAGRSKL